MKRIAMFLMLLTTPALAKPVSVKSQFKMNCMVVGGGIERCWNAEATCYLVRHIYGVNMQCFKNTEHKE